MTCLNRVFRCLPVVAIGLFVLGASPAQSQVMIANDDSFSVQLHQQLVIDPPGILDNDLLDGESAPEFGAVAQLVTPAAHGTLVLNPNGSFTYSPDATFDGLDSFVYAAVKDSVSDQATVFLTACEGGPDVFSCWKEGAFMALAAEHGYYATVESFEGPAWDIARSPVSQPSVTNLGIRWTSNFPDTPQFNPITTGSGPARTGNYGVFDPRHGFATGTVGTCDVDNPPETCLHHDGFSGEVVAGAQPLVGISGYLSGSHGANAAIVIDDTVLYPGGVVVGYQFFGVIDTRPTGFTKFKFEEQDGKIGQSLFIFGDDFTLLTTAPIVSAAPTAESRFFFAGAGPNPAGGATTWRFTLPAAAEVNLSVYDVRGRLVRQLSSGLREAGEHAVAWNGRDAGGRDVAAGTYFGKLKVGGQRGSEQVRKIIILH